MVSSRFELSNSGYGSSSDRAFSWWKYGVVQDLYELLQGVENEKIPRRGEATLIHIRRNELIYRR